jgi:hypothetical protein
MKKVLNLGWGKIYHKPAVYFGLWGGIIGALFYTIWSSSNNIKNRQIGMSWAYGLSSVIGLISAGTLGPLGYAIVFFIVVAITIILVTNKE